jgi:hypothetical protein
MKRLKTRTWKNAKGYIVNIFKNIVLEIGMSRISSIGFIKINTCIHQGIIIDFCNLSIFLGRVNNS